MKVYYNLDKISPITNAVITIGSFDGVHMAHRLILNRVIKLAKEINGESVILTFDPHPREVINPEFKLELINTKEEKIKLLEKIGIDHLVFIPFTIEFSKMSSQLFIYDILHKKLNVKKMVIGYNHYFGHNREGGFEMLYKLGGELNFSVEEIPEQDIQNESISSSKIRKAIKTGDLMKAHTYLNYDYAISGEPIDKLSIFSQFGHQSWFLKIDNEKKLIPGDGLYYAKVFLENNAWQSAILIQKNTLTDQKEIIAMLIGLDSQAKYHKAEIIFKYMIRKCPDEKDCKNLKKIIEAIIIKAGHSL